MMRPRTVVFAYSEVGAACLEELIKDGANVVKVYTHEDDPNETIWFRSVREIAERAGIPAAAPEKFGEAEIAEFAALGTELLFSFYYRKLIPQAVIDSPRLGAYNMHGALLPRYRGRACINWAVLNGERETGATLHVMTDKPDAGDIIGSEAVPIEITDTALDVSLKVAEAARRVLSRALPALEAGTAERRPQDEARATYFGRRRPEGGRIDWNKSAVEIYNLVRAVTRPFPGAFAFADGKKYFIWKAAPEEGSAQPGKIVSRAPLLVGAGSGLLRIDEIEPGALPEGDFFE
ncbi:formyltransferase [Cloacibacillus sp. An23]|uniref:formyltransferase n=1 Tax=Cloacibacillus sp. An23 TaxID=1965591 RepID=UPI000B3A656C|nr:formyltransferase [Cloacibacillus sp. An23]OUO93290.1 formyltransferase [Cloacibacillus sp. An23]